MFYHDERAVPKIVDRPKRHGADIFRDPLPLRLIRHAKDWGRPRFDMGVFAGDDREDRVRDVDVHLRVLPSELA